MMLERARVETSTRRLERSSRTWAATNALCSSISGIISQACSRQPSDEPVLPGPRMSASASSCKTAIQLAVISAREEPLFWRYGGAETWGIVVYARGMPPGRPRGYWGSFFSRCSSKESWAAEM